MNEKKNAQPPRQTAENPSGDEARNPFENNKMVSEDIEQAGNDLEAEQQFKEVQTERD